MANVALIDDEHGPIDYYVQALSEMGHQVEHFDTVEKAFAHLDGGQLADLYVVDIMMPTIGHPRLKDAADGLASGIILHREIRRKSPTVPIIVLTSISNPEILKGLLLEPNTRIESKIDTLPFELVSFVEDALSPKNET
jgi:CheY-like chemotaxis protein